MAKRAAATAALLRKQVLGGAGQSHCVFAMPGFFFLHHTDLSGELARARWEMVRNLMLAATLAVELRSRRWLNPSQHWLSAFGRSPWRFSRPSCASRVH